jgi:hypothetical protein
VCLQAVLAHDSPLVGKKLSDESFNTLYKATPAGIRAAKNHPRLLESFSDDASASGSSDGEALDCRRRLGPCTSLAPMCGARQCTLRIGTPVPWFASADGIAGAKTPKVTQPFIGDAGHGVAPASSAAAGVEDVSLDVELGKAGTAIATVRICA